jgi:uncharacterized protein (TIGR02265 family)
MTTGGIPTIKGIFVKSHIKSMEKKRGPEGVKLLEERFGKSIAFKNSDNVPVSDEIRIIEICLDLTSDTPVPPEKLAFEAGRLHFRNFSTTPLGKMLAVVLHDPDKIFINSGPVAEHVFEGITFSSQANGKDSVVITIRGGHYPLAHFQGLYYEWIISLGYEADVQAKQVDPTTYEYTLHWKKKV